MGITERKLTPVESSTIAAVGLDHNHKVMTVQFKNGSIYEYQNVDETLYNNMIEAKSVGSFFAKEIKAKSGEYPFQKVA